MLRRECLPSRSCLTGLPAVVPSPCRLTKVEEGSRDATLLWSLTIAGFRSQSNWTAQGHKAAEGGRGANGRYRSVLFGYKPAGLGGALRSLCHFDTVHAKCARMDDLSEKAAQYRGSASCAGGHVAGGATGILACLKSRTPPLGPVPHKLEGTSSPDRSLPLKVRCTAAEALRWAPLCAQQSFPHPRHSPSGP